MKKDEEKRLLDILISLSIGEELGEKIGKKLGIKKGEILKRLKDTLGRKISYLKKSLQDFEEKWAITPIKNWTDPELKAKEIELHNQLKAQGTLSTFINNLNELKVNEAITELSNIAIVNYLLTHDEHFLFPLDLTRVPYPEFRIIGGRVQLWLRIWDDTTLKDIEECWRLIKNAQQKLREISPLPESKALKIHDPLEFRRNVLWLYYREKKKLSYSKIVDKTEDDFEIFDMDTVRMAVQRLKNRMKKNPELKRVVESIMIGFNHL